MKTNNWLFLAVMCCMLMMNACSDDSGSSSNTDEIAQVCGDSVVTGDESCDDGNTDDGDGCSETCTIEDGWECKTEGEVCTEIEMPVEEEKCGDGKKTGDESCDDGNDTDGDGCTSACELEDGWECKTPGQSCTPLADPGPEESVCGDGEITGEETCDDSNTKDGDGCSTSCMIEEGWTCDGSGCKLIEPESVCGDGNLADDEACDDGNTEDGDGCSQICAVENGWTCDSSGCQKILPANVCGDGKIGGNEECDDGNTTKGDGCSVKCTVEEGYICKTEGAACTPEFDNKTSIKILGIGNSFMRDATRYLPDILLELGYKNVTVGVLYSGGRSVNDHADNIRNNNPALTYYYNVDGTEKNSSKPNYKDKIKSEKWDYVVIQQYPSGVIDLYNDDIQYVIKTVKDNATSNPKFYWAMTWGIQEGCTHYQMPFHGHNQIKMYEATINAIKAKILTNKDFVEVIPAGTAIQNMRNGIIGDNMNRDGYHMSENNGRFTAALMWAKQITKRPISNLKYRPKATESKVNLTYTDRQISAIKEAVLNAYKNPYQVTIPKKGVMADYSDAKKTLQKIFTDAGYDLSKYKELQFGATENAYYNPSTVYNGVCALTAVYKKDDTKYCYSNMISAETGGTSTTTLGKYAATKIFSRYEIPNGSVIVLKEGYQYIPDGWTDLQSGIEKSKRPATVKTNVVKVDDKWWGDFKYRAFSITKTGAENVLTAEEMAKLPAVMTIFVPTHLDDTDNADDAAQKAGYDLSKYTKLDLSVAFTSYWHSGQASNLPKLVYGTIKSANKFPSKLFDGNDTAKKYAATRIFEKSEIPNGSLIVAVKGYQYYPDAWTTLDTPNLDGTRPAVVKASDKDSIVVVDDAWWGIFNYRGFDIGRVSSPAEPTPLQQSMLADKFAIYVPKK